NRSEIETLRYPLQSVLFMIVLALASGAGALASGDPENRPSFLQGIEDVPLMPGLLEMPEESIIFDKPGGRIMESTAVTETLNAGSIRAFYEATLPQLG